MTNESVSLELAGMINGQGRLGQRVETDGILRPDYSRVTLGRQQKTLVYDTRSPLLTDVHKPEVLDEFIRLDKAAADQILKFAKAYGVLSVRAIREEGMYEEDLETWRDFAARARATLGIAACIHQGEATRPEDWKRLRPWWFDGWRRLVKPPQAERNQLADVLNAWLRLASVRPCFSWTKTSSEIVFTNVEGIDEGQLTMLGAVALQLVRAVGRARFIATCCGCGKTYLRKRQAPRRRRNYCPTCGITAAWRDAQAEHRAHPGRTTRRRAPRARKRGVK